MEKIKEFIQNNKTITIIVSALVLVLLIGGVSFGVYQSNVAKEQAAIEAQKKEEAAKKAEAKKKAEEEAKKKEAEAKKAKEEAAKKEAEAAEAEAEKKEVKNTSETKTADTKNTETKKSVNTQATNSTAVASEAAPSQSSSEPADDPASRGLVQDAYGEWVPYTSVYVVKTNQWGSVMFNDGRIVDSKEFSEMACNEINERIRNGEKRTREEWDAFETELRGF